jgi:hypothetical protein
MTEEVWLPVVGLEESYEVSSLGRVRSIYREYYINGGLYKKQSVVLKGSIAGNGYLRHSLSFRDQRYYKSVHRMVAEAFLENPNKHNQVNHKDGNKLNNNVTNLEWCSASHNINHAYDNKLAIGRAGSKNSMAKLTEAEILEIVRLYNTGMYKQKELAEMFNQKFQNISCIVNGKSWTSVTGIKLYNPGDL